MKTLQSRPDGNAERCTCGCWGARDGKAENEGEARDKGKSTGDAGARSGARSTSSPRRARVARQQA